MSVRSKRRRLLWEVYICTDSDEFLDGIVSKIQEIKLWSCKVAIKDERERITYGNTESNISFLFDNNLINKKHRILEIGAAKGYLVNYLLERGFNIEGIEIHRGFYERGKTIFGSDFPIYLTDGTTLAYEDNSFDVVMSFDVIEHIPDSDLHFQEVKRILKRDGRYLFGMPNKYTNVLFEMLFQKTIQKEEREMNDHCSLHSYWETKKRLEKNGFLYKFYDVNIVTPFLKNKIEHYFGKPGLWLMSVCNPDNLPIWLKTTIYSEAWVHKT